MNAILLMDWTLEYWVCGILAAFVIGIFVLIMSAGSDSGSGDYLPFNSNSETKKEPAQTNYFDIDFTRNVSYTSSGVPVDLDKHHVETDSSGTKTVYTGAAIYRIDDNGAAHPI